MVARGTRTLRRWWVLAAVACVTAGGTVVALLATSGSGPVPMRVVWRSDFARGSFTEWSWWGQGQASIWGHVAVVSAAAEGIPPLKGGSPDVGRFQTTAADLAQGRPNAKLYKFFSVPGTSPGTTASPPDVSGSYRAWYYLPPDFHIDDSNAWVNAFQFKEKSGSQSYPLWWVQFNSAAWANPRDATWRGPRPTRSTAPVMFLNHWDNHWTRPEVEMAVPLGRWFEIRADVVQGKRISFYVDGTLLDVADASEYPVSPFRSDSTQWIFGVGNYSTADAGPLYVGAASFSVPARR